MEPVSVELVSQGACVRGRFFPAVGATPAATLLLFPGWPGDPGDVLGLGPLLAEQGINVCMFNPRGLQQSEGIHTHAGTLQDIGAALQWLREADVAKRFEVDTTRLALGGHCYGGGMAMAYAARDPGVRLVISIAGNDHGEFARETQRSAAKVAFLAYQTDHDFSNVRRRLASDIAGWLLRECGDTIPSA